MKSLFATRSEKLVILVRSRANEANSANEAQQLIQQGADIKQTIGGKSLIDYATAAMERQQSNPDKAENCKRLIAVLKNEASNLLVISVLSPDGGNLDELHELRRLHASCYQSEKYDRLGLLGHLLKQETIPIRFEIVQFLVEQDSQVKFSITEVDNKQQTILSLAKNNSSCPQQVKEFLQKTFNMILNQIPMTDPRIEFKKIEEWIARGANPEAIDEYGNTVLLNAVIQNQQVLVEKLIGLGCNMAHRNKKNMTALQIVEMATPKNAQLETILKRQDVNMQLKQLIKKKKSLLTFEEVSILIRQGAAINTPLENKSTCLHLLIENQGTPEMVAAFINNFGADTSAMDNNRYRPIETCVLHNKSPYAVLCTCLQLPKTSSETFFNQKLNQSLLDFAKQNNRSEAAEIILHTLNLRLWNSIINVNIKQNMNQSLQDELKHLIKYGAQIDSLHSDQHYDQWTILHLACKIGNASLVQYLIEEFEANYTLANGNEDCPVSIAAEYGHLTIIEYLRKLPNISLNVANKDKQTPLHLATKNHHLLVVRYLVRWGANHRAKNVNRKTALDIAKEETTDRTLVHFLEQLVCPVKESFDLKQSRAIEPDYNLDVCELAQPILVGEIEKTSVGDEEELGKRLKGVVIQETVNDTLINAAKDGNYERAEKAVYEGANICYRKNNGRNAYDTANKYITVYQNQSMNNQLKPVEIQRYQQKMIGCQKIADFLRRTAYERMTKTIMQSKAYPFVAYHQAGAPLSADLLNYACDHTDNVQIVDYLINQNANIFQAMFEYSTADSPYTTAKKRGFNEVAKYLKYRLSLECTKAIQNNDINLVKKLIRAGASVEMIDTNNLQVAMNHRNIEMIQLLCDRGAKIPEKWLKSPNIVLPDDFAQSIDSKIVFRLNCCLINRRLRLAAASGDLQTLIHCQHLGADINSENCYGSTALLCSIEHGNYFPIVHALVSCGATIFHSNESKSMSLIKLAEDLHYTQIANYLHREVNTQFLNSILNNDIKTAAKFEQLRADFNYCDEQKRTVLHYAVQYHSLELVRWLCDRGSDPNRVDDNGNYPIIEATEKGDYPVVEFFAEHYPITKQQKNRAGLTALVIAEKRNFKRIAYLLKTGQPPPDSLLDTEPTSSDGPKHTKEELISAVKDGHLATIQAFIGDQYRSIDEKRQVCSELISVAESAGQQEILGFLRSYYKQINEETHKYIDPNDYVRLDKHPKEMLNALLAGLGQVIAKSPVDLDPADPKTYEDLVSQMMLNKRKDLEAIYQVGSDRDARILSDQDLTATNEKLNQISDQLNKFKVEKEYWEKKIQTTSEQLEKRKELTAIQRHDLSKMQKESKQQLAVYQSSILLYELQQEATLTRQNTVKFIRQNDNMYLFFRTIENHLEALFHGSLAARSGIFIMNKNTTVGKVGKAVEKVPASIVPFSEVAMGAVKVTVGTVLSKLDEKKQKKAYYNISIFGNIEELGRIATDTASILTLYYKEQIQSIDTSKKIKGSNIFNDKFNWIKNTLIDVRPEGDDEMPVILVADYITAWIIETLKKGSKYLDHNEPLPQQLWFHVAKENCIDEGRITALTDSFGATAGRQKIPVKIQKNNGQEVLTHIQLRFLIGCVSVVTGEGHIYQFDVSKQSSKEDFADLELFGYVYVTPFLMTNQSVQEIIDERKLIRASRDAGNNILTKLKDIEKYLETFQVQGDQIRKSAITAETARHVAQVLRNDGSFVDPKDLNDRLDQSRQEIKISIDGLREDIQENTEFYQTSIDATNERLQKQVEDAHNMLRKENENFYNRLLQAVQEQFKQTEQRLENKIMERMNIIERQLKGDCDRMQNIVQAAETAANQALKRANEAIQNSEHASQDAGEARDEAKKLVESTEQRRLELQKTIEKCEMKVKQTIVEQKDFCEQSIIAAQAEAKQMAISAKETTKATKAIQEDTRKQLEQEKEEKNQVLLYLKTITKQNEQLTNESKVAVKQVKQIADREASALERISEMERKMKHMYERLESLLRNTETRL